MLYAYFAVDKVSTLNTKVHIKTELCTKITKTADKDCIFFFFLKLRFSVAMLSRGLLQKAGLLYVCAQFRAKPQHQTTSLLKGSSPKVPDIL